MISSLSFERWPVLSVPVMPAETDIRARAQSIITGSLIEGKVCDPLTTEQARDVLRWFDPRSTQ